MLEGLLKDENVDCALGVLPSSPMFAFDVETPIKEIKEKYPEKPLAIKIIGSKDMVDLWTKQLEDISVPVYPSIERCIRALGALSKYPKIVHGLASDSQQRARAHSLKFPVCLYAFFHRKENWDALTGYKT